MNVFLGHFNPDRPFTICIPYTPAVSSETSFRIRTLWGNWGRRRVFIHQVKRTVATPLTSQGEPHQWRARGSIRILVTHVLLNFTMYCFLLPWLLKWSLSDKFLCLLSVHRLFILFDSCAHPTLLLRSEVFAAVVNKLFCKCSLLDCWQTFEGTFRFQLHRRLSSYRWHISSKVWYLFTKYMASYFRLQ